MKLKAAAAQYQADQGSRQQIEIAVETAQLKVQELMPSFYASARHDERQPVVNVTTRLPDPCNAQQPDPYGCPPFQCPPDPPCPPPP